MAKSVPPDAIFVPYQTAVTLDILARDGVITTERKYLLSTPEREAAPGLYEALRVMVDISNYTIDSVEELYVHTKAIEFAKEKLALVGGEGDTNAPP